MQKKGAFIISRILGPLPLLCLLWLTTALKSGIGLGRAIWVYPVIFIITIAIPTIITTYLISVKKVKDIEWSDIDQRKKYLPPITAFSVITLLFLTKILTNETIFHLSLLLSAIMVTMVLTWSFLNFKISGHIVIATLTFAGINLFYHQKFWWLFFLIPAIIWARNKLKIHTLAQLTAGFIMPATIVFLALLLFGWPVVP